ncbi:ferredoxin-thioredoxin reductase catalytic domain-containing protein [Sulfurimonas sp. ST-25]|uniref:ferredoxin-thioredoxin reductase catalytic domain-containing protein n=1 Tax=Sulfurimonas sp. ST-25 TaxID=3400151 RepID=UPI003A88531A
MAGGITKIDINSDEFQSELERTIRFTDKVVEQFGWSYNPDAEINEGIQLGLTRNKLMHGKRYCPCFFVTGDKEQDRICPCKPAIEKEIPEDGVCHCQIFCTPAYAAQHRSEEEIEEVVHQHSRGLSAEECALLLQKEQFDGDELTALLEGRMLGMVDFKLIDVREHMEWQMGHIKGADRLIPTSSFCDTLESAKLSKKEKLIVYCHVGSRSAHCQRILSDMGFENVGNLTYGIVAYGGELER